MHRVLLWLMHSRYMVQEDRWTAPDCARLTPGRDGAAALSSGYPHRWFIQRDQLGARHLLPGSNLKLSPGTGANDCEGHFSRQLPLAKDSG